MKYCFAFIACFLALALPPFQPLRAEEASAYKALQHYDTMLHRVAWNLAAANAPFCPATVGSLGIALHTAGQYNAAGQAAFGFTNSASVQLLAIAPHSPSFAAGLRADMRFDALDGVAIEPFLLQSGAESGRQLNLVNDLLRQRETADFANGQAVVVAVSGAMGPQQLYIHPIATCRAKWQLKAGSSSLAQADGEYITISLRLASFAPNDDAFAMLVAHEMAHIVLGHRTQLAALEQANAMDRRKYSRVLKIAYRNAERQADKTALWLLFNAGYNVDEAIGFWQAIKSEIGSGGGKHDRWSKRIRALENEKTLMLQSPKDKYGKLAPPLLVHPVALTAPQ